MNTLLRQDLLHRLRPDRRGTRVQLERAVNDRDLVAVLEMVPGGIESVEPEGAPRACEIGPDGNLHTE